MAFDWSVFAEEIGKTGERAAAGIRERAASERLEGRLGNLARLRKQIDFDFLQSELKYKATFDGLQYSIGLDLQGMNPEDAERTQSAVIRARQGYPVEPGEFTMLSDLNQAKIADVVRTYGTEREELKVKQDRVELERDQLAAYEARTEAAKEKAEAQAKEKARKEKEGEKKKPVDVKREIDIKRAFNADVEKDEEVFHKHRKELMNELREAKVIEKGGMFRIDTPGRLKKDVRKPLVNKAGELDMEVLGLLLERHEEYTFKFQRLFQLQANVMKSYMIRDEYLPEESTETKEISDKDIPESEIQKGIAIGLTRKEAIAWYKDMLIGK